jgi:CRP-like cAMP-binding protein
MSIQMMSPLCDELLLKTFMSQPCLNYVATEETVLLVLTRIDFMKNLAETPEMLNELRRSVKERFKLSQSS